MVNYLNRLVYVDKSKSRKINFLHYPFFFANLAYGIGFVFFGWFSGVKSSPLYSSFHMLHPYFPLIWGVFACTTGAIAIYILLTRSHVVIGEYAAFVGVLLWLFATLSFAFQGFWLVAASVGLVNLSFWLYYYFALRNYERQRKAGTLIDVDI